ncbi:hypothetical protein Sjap_001294 [Stephania japonica]|uniref:Uncharacterized protein n=1 Tax=Stephania japonica TaxID=461633 RepID=A0AAP0KLF2_9MAGN
MCTIHHLPQPPPSLFTPTILATAAASHRRHGPRRAHISLSVSRHDSSPPTGSPPPPPTTTTYLSTTTENA